MSILIRGMELPETCKLCYLSEFDPGFYAYVCKPTGIRIDYDMAKIDRPRIICPLVPVPPHGRLIDASEKIRVQIYDDMTEDFHMVEMNIDDLLSQGWVEADAPTIIPAEEKRKEEGEAK